MSQVYNPEVAIKEQLAQLALEARRLRRKLSANHGGADEPIYGRQLREIEQKIARLQQRIVHLRKTAPENHPATNV